MYEEDGNKEKLGLGELRVESTPCVDLTPSHSDGTEIPPEVVEAKAKDAKRKRKGTLAERMMREGKKDEMWNIPSNLGVSHIFPC